MFQVGQTVRIRFGYYTGWHGSVACVTGWNLRIIGVRVDDCFCVYLDDELEAVA